MGYIADTLFRDRPPPLYQDPSYPTIDRPLRLSPSCFLPPLPLVPDIWPRMCVCVCARVSTDGEPSE